MEQRTEDWMQARLGKVTASRVADVMARIKSGYGAARKNYMCELLCQRLTGKFEEGFNSAAMQRGTELEPVARSIYEMLNDVMVTEVGFLDHPDISEFGASPDGLVGKDGLIEIKCPNTATHIEFLQTGKIDNRYLLQMYSQMMCANREWCDFVSFDDRLPESLAYKCVRVNWDDDKVGEIVVEVSSFLDELASLEEELRKIAA